MITNTSNEQTCIRPCRVMVRCRPLNKRQIEQSDPTLRQKIVRKNQDTLYLYEPDLSQPTPIRFNFDKIFLEGEDNLDVFDYVNNVLNDLIKGYNTAILAYGMTGAGKSYTMFGTQNQQGLVSMILKYLLSLEETKVNLSVMELYNQQIRDLIVQNSHNLALLEDSQGNILIPQLSQHQLTTIQTVQNILKLSTSKRVTASTSSNIQSSRSHCLIRVSILQTSKNISSKLFLVDLAGSEKAINNRGVRLQEGANINKSLLSLSNCITHLSQGSAFVPYRDSKLTRLLKQCLGGNAQTLILACISPSYLSYEQTMNTLKYSSKASKIKKSIVLNNQNDDKSQLQFLRRQVQMLRQMMKGKQNRRPISPQPRKSCYKTPISPACFKNKKSPLQRQNEVLRNIIKQKDNQIQQKDQKIKQLTKQLYNNTQPIKQRSNASSFEKIVKHKRSDIPKLQMIRQKTRPFKNKLKIAYKQYEQLQFKDNLPSNLIQLIHNLAFQYSQGNILISEQYTNVLWQLKKLADLSLQ